MNFKKLGKILGKIMVLEGIMLLAPLVVALIYSESAQNVLAFALPAVLLVGIGLLLQLLKPERNSLYQKEGFALTALAWLVMALFGALPFMLNGEIPRFEDAFFEIMSGFTTTGASIVRDITALSHSTLFWRSFSQWIGGMGILVFVLIFIPESNEGSSMHLLRAESPGPQVGKLVSKMKVTTRILYLIYLGLTVLEVGILMLDKPIPGYEGDQFFISLVTALSSASTGGFGVLPGSMELFHPFSQYVVSIFLLLFGINFSLYYLLLIGKIREVIRSEELKSYFIIVAISVIAIFLCLVARFDPYPQTYTTEEAFRHSLFQVASIITTTGFSTTDFNTWPQVAAIIITALMITGAMAGSTAGGVKISRIVIALKGMRIKLRKLINPRYVPSPDFEGKSLEASTINDVFAFLVVYCFISAVIMFLLAFDPISSQTFTVVSDAGEYSARHGFHALFTSAISCLSNIGPSFEAIGPYAGYADYSVLSKLVLSLAMLIGRLEIFPVLIFFSRKTWKKV